MKLFVSYSKADRDKVGSIPFSLKNQGHDVFFDEANLAPGMPFTKLIEEEIVAADCFVFFASENSLRSGSYSLSELEIAHKTGKRILAVRLDEVPVSSAPGYLQVNQWFVAKGDLEPELVASFQRELRLSRRSFVVKGVVGGGLALVGGVFAYPRLFLQNPVAKKLVTNKKTSVIHHLDICKKHLPVLDNRRVSRVNDTMHSDLLAQIYEALAREEMVDDEKIKFLVRAIEVDPTAIRVFDQLVKVLGRVKRYENIHLFLSLGQSRNLELAEEADNKHLKKTHQKAAISLALRRDRASKRAALSI